MSLETRILKQLTNAGAALDEFGDLDASKPEIEFRLGRRERGLFQTEYHFSGKEIAQILKSISEMRKWDKVVRNDFQEGRVGGQRTRSYELSGWQTAKQIRKRRVFSENIKLREANAELRIALAVEEPISTLEKATDSKYVNRTKSRYVHQVENLSLQVTSLGKDKYQFEIELSQYAINSLEHDKSIRLLAKELTEVVKKTLPLISG